MSIVYDVVSAKHILKLKREIMNMFYIVNLFTKVYNFSYKIKWLNLYQIKGLVWLRMIHLSTKVQMEWIKKL